MPILLFLLSQAAPTHLVVLQHGLYGGASNLAVLQNKLHELGHSDVIAHLAESNENLLTRDGVEAGGRRLAAEIRSLAAANPSLRTLSLVGNSLGGLYVRAAAAELLEGDGMMANLQPKVLVTTGCPHLGVRRYTYLPLPSFMHPAGRAVAGQTADDLLLRDAERGQRPEPLLLAMSRAEGPHGRALRCFQQRRLYANLVGDFMVPFGTAAIEVGGWSAGVGDAALSTRFTQRDDVSFRDASVCEGRADGVAVICEQAGFDSDGGDRDLVIEERMRRGLSSVSWSKCAVGFRGVSTLLPMAHNKLPALRRDGWRRAFEFVEQAHEGAGVMQHCAEFIVAGLAD